MLLVSKGVVALHLLLLVKVLLLILINALMVFTIHLVHMCVLCLIFLTLHAHSHKFFLLGQLPSLLIILLLLVAPLVLPCLLLLHRLQAHPVFIVVGLTFLTELLLDLLLAIQVSHVRHFFCLINLLSHQPFIHIAAPFLILLSLVLCHNEELLLNIVLSLGGQLTLHPLLCILVLYPFLVSKALSPFFIQIIAAMR